MYIPSNAVLLYCICAFIKLIELKVHNIFYQLKKIISYITYATVVIRCIFSYLFLIYKAKIKAEIFYSIVLRNYSYI